MATPGWHFQPPGNLYPIQLFIPPPTAGFGPTSGKVDDIDGVDEHSSGGGTTMGNGIGFQETRLVLIPLIGPDGDMLLKDGSLLGGGQSQSVDGLNLLLTGAINRSMVAGEMVKSRCLILSGRVRWKCFS